MLHDIEEGGDDIGDRLKASSGKSFPFSISDRTQSLVQYLSFHFSPSLYLYNNHK